LGQARCGIFFSWQFGHSARLCAFSESCARRVEVRFWECRRFGLGMVLKFLSKKLSALSFVPECELPIMPDKTLSVAES